MAPLMTRQTQLSFTLNFTAAHTLGPDDPPHSHLWRMHVVLSGKVVGGKIVDLVSFRKRVNEQLLEPISGGLLNDCANLGSAARAMPTCETLSEEFCETLQRLIVAHYHPIYPTLHLVSVGVALDDLGEVRQILVEPEGS